MRSERVLEFFQTMYQFCEGTQIEFRCLPSKKQFFIPLTDPLRLPVLPNTNQNIYFAPATRNGGGTKAHIEEIPCTWIDLDFNHTPKDEANEKLKYFPLKPSVLINSGGGYHVYWLLKEPLGKDDVPGFEVLLKRLATYFDSDMAATDASRILRVPGSLNFKYEPPRKVKIIDMDPSLTYEADDFDQLLPELKGPVDSNGRIRNERGWQNGILKGVSEGNRHRDALRLAGRWAVKGHSPEEIAHFLVAWNQSNNPPKESLSNPNSEEIRNIISYVMEENQKGQFPKEEPLQFPHHVMTGIAGDFAELFSLSLEPPKEFFFMSWLTCLGSVLSQRLTLSSEIAPQPRYYIILLGESADERKSTAIDKTTELFKESLDRFNMCLGVGSAEGLQKRLENSPQLLLCFDEFKQFISKCKIEASVLLPCVNTLFESNRYESRTKKTDIYLEGVYLSILAASTIPTYENTWTSQFTDMGFTNRLFLVPATGQRKFSIPDKIPESERDEIKRRLRKVLKHVGGSLEMDITPEGKDIFHGWYMDLERSIHAKRLDTYALRFMPLLAVNELKNEVDTDSVKKAIALCDWQLNVRRLYDPIDADNEIARMEEKIRRVLRAKGDLKDWELKRGANANKKGLWIYTTAQRNLRNAGEVGFNTKQKTYFLRNE